jgi:uncharacterized protein (TIGR02145 family)
MGNRLKTGIYLLVIVVSFLILAISCKKDDNDEPIAVNDIDGNGYHAVTIGTQVWLLENLKTTKYNDGTAILQVTGDEKWVNLSTPGYCWYNNNEVTYKAEYGALYNWFTVNTGNLCPTGWHVPTDQDWHQLVLFLDPSAVLAINESTVAGGMMKETGTTHWESLNTGATNESGFTALPGGYRSFNGTFQNVGENGVWWSSSEYSSANAYYRLLYHFESGVLRRNFNKLNGFSVRCLRD